ncbi:class I SAM-dependent methyltransferase [Caenimonas terrae]|uniref:Class I SAM-dependent methyltransferase n=1 Tax=Caenimonas terrae TaxID=696074 RepID=A0ABW0NF84_9BURK
MQLSLSGSERFLAGFHDADPGVTSRAFARLPARMADCTFPSSYECLAAVVPSGPGTLVDLACGDGYLLALLAARRQAGLSLVGIDLSAGELAAARRRLGPAVLLHQARAQALPLADASADTVLCHMALMLLDDAPRVLEEVRRVLKPGGVFAVVVGGGAAASPAHEVVVSLLRQSRKLPEFESLRLGDSRLYAPDGIAELFGPAFGLPAIDDILLLRRSGPDGLWDWFSGLYNMAWLGPADRAAIGPRFVQEVAPLCNADGKMEHRVMLRRITARRGLD